jgi:NAD(P)-dependent dehydrogenase (short-subunit alcohol dehydrogenase family)
MPKTLYCDETLLKTDLSGKTAVVTGSSSGIGEVTARQLAKQGAEVVLACRDRSSAEAAMRRIQKEVPAAQIEWIPLSLDSLASVRAFAQEFNKRHQELHLLVNNAGVMNTPRGKTEDGFETQIGVNHLGHFLLTELLLPTLKRSAPARIINVSSCFHDQAMGRPGDIHFDDLFFERRKYDGWAAYAQSKLANLLHAKELSRRLQGTNVTAVSVHPGWVRTRLMRHSMPIWMQDWVVRPALGLFGQLEPWEGAQATLHAALSPQVPEQAGAYFSQSGIYRNKALNAGGFPLRSPNPNAHDDAKAAKLYEVSQKLVGLGAQAAQAAE